MAEDRQQNNETFNLRITFRFGDELQRVTIRKVLFDWYDIIGEKEGITIGGGIIHNTPTHSTAQYNVDCFSYFLTAWDVVAKLLEAIKRTALSFTIGQVCITRDTDQGLIA